MKIVEALHETSREVVKQFTIEFDGEKFMGEIHETTDSYFPNHPERSLYWVNKVPLLNYDEEVFDLL